MRGWGPRTPTLTLGAVEVLQIVSTASAGGQGHVEGKGVHAKSHTEGVVRSSMATSCASRSA